MTDALTDAKDRLIDPAGRHELQEKILKRIRKDTDVKVDDVLFPDVTVQWCPTPPGVRRPGSRIRPAGRCPAADGLERLRDVPVELTCEIGRTAMTIGEALALAPGSIVSLNRLAGEPVDLLVNGKPIARGEVVVTDEEFGLRITEITSSAV